MNYLKPAKFNVLGTAFVYVALLISSSAKVVIVRIFYPSEIFNKTAEIVDTVDRGAGIINPMTAIVVLIATSAIQIFSIYFAISFAKHLSKRNEKGKS